MGIGSAVAVAVAAFVVGHVTGWLGMAMVCRTKLLRGDVRGLFEMFGPTGRTVYEGLRGYTRSPEN